MTNRRPREQGFTLIEVMVALLVVALALPALLTTLSRQIDGTAHLRDKSMAQWVASNKLAELRLQQARRGAVFEGQRSGVTTQAERDWFWWVEGQATEVENFYRLEINVASAEDQQDNPLVTLVAFTAARGTEDRVVAPRE